MHTYLLVQVASHDAAADSGFSFFRSHVHLDIDCIALLVDGTYTEYYYLLKMYLLILYNVLNTVTSVKKLGSENTRNLLSVLLKKVTLVYCPNLDCDYCTFGL